MMGQEDVANLVFEASMPSLSQLWVSPWLPTAHPLSSRFASKGSSAAEAAIPQSSGGGLASGMSCCGKGFSHIYELIFCWVFLSLLPLPSVLSKSWPSPHPTRSLAFLNPHAQSLCLHSSSSRPPLPYWALSLFQACGCVLSHSWTPLTSHSVLQHHSQVHLVAPFETPLNLTCQVLADILTTCSNELQLAIVIADEHTLSVEVLLSASSDRWF